MKVGLLLITHDDLAQAFIDVARTTLGECPLKFSIVNACQECEPEDLLRQAERKCKELDYGQGVLVLTDLYGSTPSNVAARLAKQTDVSVVAGLNLPMLLSVLNYPREDLKGLTEKALDAGHNGILRVE